MPLPVSRRDFIAALGATFAGSLLGAPALRAIAPLYPPVDLSYFRTPVTPAPAEIRWGYAAITWNGNDRQAIDDIAALGFPGIQVRTNAIEEFNSSAQALRDLLDQHQLKLVAFSSGELDVDSSEDAQLMLHTDHAKFLRDAGGSYLQVIGARPKNRVVVDDDYKNMGHMLTDLGKRTADIGVQLGFHNHMYSLGQSAGEVDKIFDAVDPRYAKLELDIAHYWAAGGDPAKAVEEYHDRLLFLHIKDAVTVTPSKESDNRPYRFVELGQGTVDIPAVFAALQEIQFRGWAVIELDGPTDPSRTPKQSAEISKTYVEQKLGYTI
ncbi:MAG: sugar phosphate isomerase/epimerase [Candidatus Acidiferrales bacterium]